MLEVPVAQVLAPRFVQLSTKRPHLEVQRQGLIAYLTVHPSAEAHATTAIVDKRR